MAQQVRGEPNVDIHCVSKRMKCKLYYGMQLGSYSKFCYPTDKDIGFSGEEGLSQP